MAKKKDDDDIESKKGIELELKNGRKVEVFVKIDTEDRNKGKPSLPRDRAKRKYSSFEQAARVWEREAKRIDQMEKLHSLRSVMDAATLYEREMRSWARPLSERIFNEQEKLAGFMESVYRSGRGFAEGPGRYSATMSQVAEHAALASKLAESSLIQFATERYPLLEQSLQYQEALLHRNLVGSEGIASAFSSLRGDWELAINARIQQRLEASSVLFAEYAEVHNTLLNATEAIYGEVRHWQLLTFLNTLSELTTTFRDISLDEPILNKFNSHFNTSLDMETAREHVQSFLELQEAKERHHGEVEWGKIIPSESHAILGDPIFSFYDTKEEDFEQEDGHFQIPPDNVKEVEDYLAKRIKHRKRTGSKWVLNSLFTVVFLSWGIADIIKGNITDGISRGLSSVGPWLPKIERTPKKKSK